MLENSQDCLLCRSQINETYNNKWTYFDLLVDMSIIQLSEFEDHWENIYTGICNVLYQFKNDHHDKVMLKTHVSFTTSLDVAKEFRGDEGMIIGMNVKRSCVAISGNFKVCDVSWISRFPSEKEILCRRSSIIYFYRSKFNQIGKINGLYVMTAIHKKHHFMPCLTVFER